MTLPRILLAVESLAPGNGGICRVARMMARVLVEQQESGSLTAEALILSDREAPANLPLSTTLARSSRPRFVLDNYRAAFGHTHFIYDFAGISRAHPRIPLLKRPYLTFIHGIEVWEEAKPVWVDRARAATMLLSNTEYTRQRADRLHGGLAHARVCWLATETDDPPAEQCIGDSPPTVLIVARIDEGGYKGHKQLIECWPKVTSAVPEARLVVVGRGPGLQEMQHLAASSSAAARIEFKGFVPEEQMSRIWANATVFAMPSRGEGFGLVYIEAMRHSIPVIASIHDAAPEVNLDGQTGYNIDMDSPQQLADRLVDLLRNRDKAACMGRAGQDRWREHFRYSAFRDRFTKLLLEFLQTS